MPYPTPTFFEASIASITCNDSSKLIRRPNSPWPVAGLGSSVCVLAAWEGNTQHTNHPREAYVPMREPILTVINRASASSDPKVWNRRLFCDKLLLYMALSYARLAVRDGRLRHAELSSNTHLHVASYPPNRYHRQLMPLHVQRPPDRSSLRTQPLNLPRASLTGRVAKAIV